MGSPIKVLIVNETDTMGGAAKAAYRLHLALQRNRVDSRMLVSKKYSNDPTILGPKTMIQKQAVRTLPTIDRALLRFCRIKSEGLFSPAWVAGERTTRSIERLRPDVVHLHWINNGLLRIEQLSRIQAPIVWSLHDMWPFTGGCHYDEGCGGYEKVCGRCMVLNSERETDLSARVYERKKRAYARIKDVSVVALSRWMRDSANSSSLLKDVKTWHIPNLIDARIYKPLDSRICRDLYNLPKDKKLILFGAMDGERDRRKGYAELMAALNAVNDDSVELVVFGRSTQALSQCVNPKLHKVGLKHDDESLVALYNACDCLVVPSLQENLSNVIMESLSCGTPVVAFGIGGNGDMITHKRNGFIASPCEPGALLEGIRWILELPREDYRYLSWSARSGILGGFSEEAVVGRYIELYREIAQPQ